MTDQQVPPGQPTPGGSTAAASHQRSAQDEARREVALATAVKRQLDERAAAADKVWRAGIRAAVAAGVPVVVVAEMAGISRMRVYQIRDGRR